MALTLGLSYDALAVAALDALEHWKTCISQSVLKPLLYEILPYFDGYLQAGSDKRGTLFFIRIRKFFPDPQYS